ncbi:MULTISPECIES: ubiquinone anaerobic biosynthesis protein UbiU [unclassified Pseudoalteromonas]|uniref:ubiquinone anaerobic biosynthesis protein UbiU n=1 Tax=unclassified Pseudoalteromonas TaxID=194690 RepID=UPI000CF65C82|nr:MULTISPECIES: peptidase U32 family protein [unclassified Pseudoalteromonas]
MELLCPAGSYKSLQAAVDNGADAVYIGFKDQTNARHFAGLNFSPKQLEMGVEYIRRHQRRLHIAINTFAHPDKTRLWQAAIDRAVELGADVLIVADLAMLEYCSTRYPEVELHASVQVSATNLGAIALLKDSFNVSRVVLPRVLSIHQIRQLSRHCPVELEVFAYGSLCIMAEGRCYLSSYLTGESPNTAGACSPARFVEYRDSESVLETRLNDIVIDRFSPQEKAGYPTLCKGRFAVAGNQYHVLEEPTSLNSMELLPELMALGISAIKIEGRQRSPTYVADVTRTWRQAIDACRSDAKHFSPSEQAQRCLQKYSEGSQTTLGAYHKKWK